MKCMISSVAKVFSTPMNKFKIRKNLSLEINLYKMKGVNFSH